MSFFMISSMMFLCFFLVFFDKVSFLFSLCFVMLFFYIIVNDLLFIELSFLMMFLVIFFCYKYYYK